MSAPRYAPQRKFPAYAFLPGKDPHPTGDPRGHSYGATADHRGLYFTPQSWRDNEEYLFGVDLYNHGYLWEAHEAWESLWHGAKHDVLQAEFLQGLIQCTAAALKARMQQAAGVEKLSKLALSRLGRVAREAGPRFMGLDVAAFAREFRAFASSAPTNHETRPHLVLA